PACALEVPGVNLLTAVCTYLVAGNCDENHQLEDHKKWFLRKEVRLGIWLSGRMLKSLGLVPSTGWNKKKKEITKGGDKAVL
ncbi:hypothetical protein ACQP3J_33425, partial [Escherichia coli]